MLTHPLFIGCWLACHVVLWGLWRFGLREMAFFRLVLEVVGENSWLRWPLGIGGSLVVAWLAFVTVYPQGCRF